MNGFTVKSISEEGTYYLVRDWRKNKAIWVEESKLKQEYLYKSANTSIRTLEKLLNVMDEYATDKLIVVAITDGNIVERWNVSIKNNSDDEWKNDYKAELIVNNKLEEVIKDATEKALKIDGYNQAIILENDGTYAFTRSYEGCCPEWLGKIIGEVIAYWDNGILKARYVTL